jgi:nucleoside-diphosphate-sugar epimerase
MSADRILVTGIGGAVGSELAAALATALATRAPSAELVGVFSGERSRDAFLARAPHAVVTALRPVICDLTDPVATAAQARELGPARRTVLVHAAANVSWTATAEAARIGNVEATRNTADLARVLGGTRFVLVSSAYTATTDWDYRNTYEESKAAAERILRAEYAALDPVVFSCGLVVGHSVTGAISRFHGIYPLLGLVERYEPPFLPGDVDGRVDIVPVDWVADELCGLTLRVLTGQAVTDVVAAAGDGAPRLGELVGAVVAALNRARRADRRPELPDMPLVPYRRWDFLRRSVAAWQVTEIRMPNQKFLERLIGVYRPYFENARVRPPQGTATAAPPWRDYLDIVVNRWLADVGRPSLSGSPVSPAPMVGGGRA